MADVARMAGVADPLARGPVPPAEPTAIVDGWLVSARQSQAELVAADCTPLSKALVRAPLDGAVADHLDVPHGRCRRDDRGRLVVGSGPGEWLILAAADRVDLAADTAAAVAAVAAPGEVATVVDVTHGRALVRVTGALAQPLLARVCALDLSTAIFRDGDAARTAVAGIVCEVVRDDRGGRLSLLVGCETSSGRYLFDTLLDAGRPFGIEVVGFALDPLP